jgi:hypothetical protein
MQTSIIDREKSDLATCGVLVCTTTDIAHGVFKRMAHPNDPENQAN